MEENKKTNHRGFKIFIIIFLLSSLFLLKEENQEKLIKIFDSIGGKEKVLRLNHSFKHNGDIEDINFYDGNIIKWTNSKISFMKTDGTIILEKQFNFQDPSIYFGDKYIYALDKSTGDIYSFNKNGDTIDRIQLNKEIFNIKECYNNLIYQTKSMNMESLSILDKDMVLIGNYTYEDNNILTSSTNKDGSLNTIAILNFKEDILKSQIESYGENNSKIISLDIEGEIVVYLKNIEDDNLVALTDRAVYFINNGKLMWKKQFELIKDIYISQDKIFILYSNYLETIDFEGRTLNKVGFSEEYKKIVPMNNKIIIYNDYNLILIDGDEQILKHNESIIGVYANKDKILIWGPEDLKTYDITNKR